MPENAQITQTECCALFQISGISNDSTIVDIQEAIDEVKEDEDMHGRAVFVITMKEEVDLVAKLKELDFKKVTTFSRKYCYEQTGLTMWLKKLDYKEEYDEMIEEEREMEEDYEHYEYDNE